MHVLGKLMNTIYIILTHQIDFFPVEQLIQHFKKNYQERKRAHNRWTKSNQKMA